MISKIPIRCHFSAGFKLDAVENRLTNRVRRWSINKGLGRPYLVLATGSAVPWNKSSSELARKPWAKNKSGFTSYKNSCLKLRWTERSKKIALSIFSQMPWVAISSSSSIVRASRFVAWPAYWEPHSVPTTSRTSSNLRSAFSRDKRCSRIT